jgi:hypothetical protein
MFVHVFHYLENQNTQGKLLDIKYKFYFILLCKCYSKIFSLSHKLKKFALEINIEMRVGLRVTWLLIWFKNNENYNMSTNSGKSQNVITFFCGFIIVTCGKPNSHDASNWRFIASF